MVRAARPGHAASQAAPSKAPSAASASIAPGVGGPCDRSRPDHSPARITARAHWRQTSAIVITATVRGSAPSRLNRPQSAGSADSRARPFTRSTVAEPGTMDISETGPARRMLRGEPVGSLLRRSGSSGVRSSATCSTGPLHHPTIVAARRGIGALGADGREDSRRVTDRSRGDRRGSARASP
jgi:hypothetical protein